MAQPCIIYALVARQTVVLAEYNGSNGNASTVALKILDKLANSSNGNRASYLVDHHAFHVLVSENMIYLAMTTQETGRRIAFAFLDEVKEKFCASHGTVASTALAYTLDAAFDADMEQLVSKYSDPRADQLTRVQAEVENLRGTMVSNIENILERGERLELLVQRTEGLDGQTILFKQQASSFRRKNYWDLIRTRGCLWTLVLLALYCLAAVLCGPTLKCITGDGDTSQP